MSYRLVAVDLDDSLLGEDHQISDENKRTIYKAIERGVLVTIATGRPLQSCMPFVKELGLDVPFIIYNGAMVVKGGCLEPIYHRVIDAQDAIEIINQTRDFQPTYFVFQDHRLYVNEFNERTRRYTRFSNMEAHLESEIERIAERHPTKVLLYHTPEAIRRIYATIKDHFAGRLNYHISKPFFLEFVHREASKGVALSSLANKYQIPREEIIAIGDSYNDISMIRYAGLGVAMANAYEEIKEHADVVTTSNAENGVAQVIKQYILEE